MLGDDWSDLDAAFELPEWITDEKFQVLYEHIIHRMRNEAKGVPMSTVQQLLIERIATNYIIMKMREGKSAEAGGFTSAAALKDFNTWWLASTQEFNKILKVQTPESVKRAVFEDVKNVIMATLESVVDKKLKEALMQKFLAEISAAGL